MSGSQFEDPRLGVYCCAHVLRHERPILLVTHEADGDWQFLCGGTDHDGEGPHHVHLHHVLDADPALHDLADLRRGWDAERPDTTSGWTRTKSDRPDE
jgi:hypothetical protein